MPRLLVPTRLCALVPLATGLSGLASQELAPLGPPTIPQPRECAVARPRSVAELYAVLDVAVVGTPAPHAFAAGDKHAARVAIETALEEASASFTPPAGVPADPYARGAVAATIRQLYACYNGNDFLALLALVTDDAIRRFPGGLDGPTPRDPAFQVGYLPITDVRQLPDGRIGALVETVVEPTTSGAVRSHYLLVHAPSGR